MVNADQLVALEMIFELFVSCQLAKGNDPRMIADLVSEHFFETERRAFRQFGKSALNVTEPIISLIDGAVYRAIASFANGCNVSNT